MKKYFAIDISEQDGPMRASVYRADDVDRRDANGAALLAARAERIAELEKVLRSLKQPHHTCDDSWYSCPLSAEGCADKRETECNCGASAINEKIDAVLGHGKGGVEWT